MSQILPGGGIAPSASPEEKFYLVLEGEVIFETPDGVVMLGVWDSCRIAPNEMRALRNETKRPATVLLAMPLPNTARG
jgi:mannose-6-phosphate isomerase-like protein (cupin superfamily)